MKRLITLTAAALLSLLPAFAQRIEPPLGVKWEDGIMDVIERLSKIESVSAIKVEVMGETDKYAILLSASASREEWLAAIGAKIDAQSWGLFSLDSGKEQKYIVNTMTVRAKEISLDGTPFIVAYEFVGHPGLFLTNPDKVIISTNDKAMPGALEAVRFYALDKNVGWHRENLAKAFEKHVPTAVMLYMEEQRGRTFGGNSRSESEIREEMLHKLKTHGQYVTLRGHDETSVGFPDNSLFQFGYIQYTYNHKKKLDAAHRSHLEKLKAKEQALEAKRRAEELSKPTDPADMKDSL